MSAKIEINRILELIRDKSVAKAEVNGHMVKVRGVRLSTFAYKGVDCICCNAKGAYFKVDHNDGWGHHLNLYAISPEGNEVLMTRDHIIPHSHGGPNTLDNMNPMCRKCNSRRGTQDLNTFIHNYKKGILGIPKTKSTKGPSLHPDVKDIITRHVEEWGTSSHLSDVFMNMGLSKKWKRELYYDKVLSMGDNTGIEFMEIYMQKSQAWRAKVSKWYRYKFMKGLVETTASKSISVLEETNDPKICLSILKTAAIKLRDNPTSAPAINNMNLILSILKTKEL